MAESGSILVVDDEVLFLQSVADLLRREGYDCDIAANSDTAIQMLSQNDYDLLISDINMPGNANLEFIERLSDVVGGLPVILVTGYPSLESAIQAVQLPVVAYLVKPIDLDKLLIEVKRGIEQFQVYQSVRGTRQRLQAWNQELNNLEQSMKGTHRDASSAGATAFLALTMRNIAGSLEDIRQLTDGLTRSGTQPQYACQLLNCQRAKILTDTLLETIAVLEKTRSAFKSKELGALRKKLEDVVKHWGSA